MNKNKYNLIAKMICSILTFFIMMSLIPVSNEAKVTAIGESAKTKSQNKSKIIKYNNISSFYSQRTAIPFGYASSHNYKIYNFKEREKVNKFLKDKEFEEVYMNSVQVKENKQTFGTNYLSKTISQDDTDYLYYGKFDSKNRPTGIGVLFRIPNLSFQTNTVPEVVYVGNFKNGYYNGYGATFASNSDITWTVLSEEERNQYYYFINDINYEGYFKKGKKSGKGNYFENNVTVLMSGYGFDESYDSNDESSDNENDDFKKMDEIIKQNLTYLVYVGKSKKDKKTGKYRIYFKGKLEYIGDYNEKEGYTGKGKLYYIDTGKLKYTGEFKNNKYDGKGTLYDENGKIIHKGTFENGDIK